MSNPFHKRFGDFQAWLWSQDEQQREAAQSTGWKIRPKSSPRVAPCCASILGLQNLWVMERNWNEDSSQNRKMQIFNTKTTGRFCSWLPPLSRVEISSGCVAWIIKSKDKVEWELVGFCCNYCLFGFFQVEMIVNMCAFFFLHARFVFRVKPNYSEEQPMKNKHMKYRLKKKAGGKRQEEVRDAEINRSRMCHPCYLRKTCKNLCTFPFIHEDLIKAPLPWKPLVDPRK